MNLENDIQLTTERIETRKTEFESKIDKLEKKILFYTRWAWGFVIIGFLISAYGLYCFMTQKSEQFELNLLGDFYGGTVASIWSLAGLFFIYVAFLGQKQQLLNQQMEIMYSQLEVKYTRFELEGQKIEMQEQNATLRLQRFENTFFQLLRNHQDIVNGIDIRKAIRGTGELAISNQGRDCFKIFYERFKSGLSDQMQIESIMEKYMTFYHQHQADLGHYFRNLYHILKHIKYSTEIIETEKPKYASLLRALLSSYELSLLFYNGLGEYGKTDFKPLIEEFSFLKNLDIDLLVSKKHMELYNKLAFASSRRRNEMKKIEKNAR